MNAFRKHQQEFNKYFHIYFKEFLRKHAKFIISDFIFARKLFYVEIPRINSTIHIMIFPVIYSTKLNF